MPLKCFFPDYEQKNLFLSLSVRLRAISIFRIKVLANWASWFSTRLFLCPYSSGIIYRAGIEAFNGGSLRRRTNHLCDVKKEHGSLQAAGIRFKVSFQAYDDPEYRRTPVGEGSSYCHGFGDSFRYGEAVSTNKEKLNLYLLYKHLNFILYD